MGFAGGSKFMFKKIWKFLNGKKRRIALLAALAAQAIPDQTVSLILNGIAIVLGGSDLAQASRKKLPSGIK